MTQMPTGIFTRSERVEAVAIRDNAVWGNQWKPEWRYEVCFAKQLGIGRNGVAEHPFGSTITGCENRVMMAEWCNDNGVEAFRLFASGVGFPNEQDQLLCYLAWK